MLFYTIEFEDFERYKTIMPRIPENIEGEENDFLPRIILSPSIKLCLQNLLQRFNRDIDENTVFYIYSAEIDENDMNLFGPDILYNERFVYHAYENKEYWYMIPLKMAGKRVKLTHFDREFDFAWKSITKHNIYNAAKYAIKNKKIFPVIENLIEEFDDQNNQKLFYEITDILDENNLYEELEMFEAFLARDWKNTINKIKKFTYDELNN